MIHDFSHGVMFHHFHDGLKHTPSQGSMSAAQFGDMLDWLADRYNLVSADDYQTRVKTGDLDRRDICMTFDDALLCQYEVALPELKKRGIKAFFFIYSGPYQGKPDYLELFRTFRHRAFDSMEAFYEAFFAKASASHEAKFMVARQRYEDAPGYLRAYPFYTDNDRWFRYLRDESFTRDEYREIMLEMMRSADFDPEDVADDLWMSEKHIQSLAGEGHVIGLHSFSHPTVMSALPYGTQIDEYRKNHSHLKDLCGRAILSMSHPCNSYSQETLSILKNLGIELGFCATVEKPLAPSQLEIPREDHANILRAMSRHVS